MSIIHVKFYKEEIFFIKLVVEYPFINFIVMIKIDNLVQIAHNVRTGENCIVVAQVGISGSVNIGNNVMLGGQAGIRDHVDIGDNVMVSAKGGITKSVPPKTIMSGIPARPHNVMKRLVAHVDNLPKIVERVDELEKKLKKLTT